MLSNFSLKEKIFILSAMLCGFLIGADYAIIRPVSNSLFLHYYGSSYFPYAWLFGVPVSFLVVSLYNRFLSQIGCWKMFLSVAGCVVVVNLFTALFANAFHSLSFLFYVWKEVYIMLMFQLLWSIINSTIDQKKAKSLYGFLFGCGALGGIFGSLVPGFFAVKIGSEALILATIPIYLVLAVFYRLLLTHGGQITFEKKADLFQGLRLIGNSRFLLFILCLVVMLQLSSTIIDFQFQKHLEIQILDKDLRTQYAGRIFSMIHAATLSLQFIGTFLLLQFLGLKGAHFFVPIALCLSNIGYLLFPFFGVLSFDFILIKSFDFSLFGIIREMLYIPLKTEERFHAKAFIDVFGHRSSKALASFVILALSPAILTWANICVFAIWCIIVVMMFKARRGYERNQEGAVSQ